MGLLDRTGGQRSHYKESRLSRAPYYFQHDKSREAELWPSYLSVRGEEREDIFFLACGERHSPLGKKLMTEEYLIRTPHETL